MAQVCLKQHMWRNATTRPELLRCNLFLYVEGPGAAGGGSGQVVWSAMHPRTVTTGALPVSYSNSKLALLCVK